VRHVSDLLDVRVVRILLVESAQGGLEAAPVAGLEYLGHFLGVIAEVRYPGK